MKNQDSTPAVRAQGAPRAAGRPLRVAAARLFDAPLSAGSALELGAYGVARTQWRDAPGGIEVTRDDFTGAGASCSFVRIDGAPAAGVRCELAGAARVAAVPAGGWLIAGRTEQEAWYWVPQPPCARRRDAAGRITDEQPLELRAFDAAQDGIALEFQGRAGYDLDCVIWRVPGREAELLASLRNPAVLETQAIFLWGSHTAYGKAADVYIHLIDGQVYENRWSWPHRRKVWSENDAHALWVALSGLEAATGRRLYALLKAQLLISVLARQSPDGGWRHGEWTDAMEAHYRLNASAVHMLLDAAQGGRDPGAQERLERAVAFLSRQRDETRFGAWFLHDELEHSVAGMKQAPFAWLPSRAFGKAESNMMVLNTHLDTTIAIDRYRALSGAAGYDALLESARNSARELLRRRPAQWLYRLVFRAIDLTSLPAGAAARLPLALRAVKRIAWRYLIPNLYRLKTRYPRLVMPNGYIDRAINLQGWAFHYLTINIMDLLRYQRRFGDGGLREIVSGALDFTHRSGILARWSELRYERYALGFWAEALYHACLEYGEDKHRAWLAEAVLMLEDAAMGLPPSLLGANSEALAPERQLPCPVPQEPRLRVANLGRRGRAELLVVNPAADALPCRWREAPPWLAGLEWRGAQGGPVASGGLIVPPRAWIRGCAAPEPAGDAAVRK